MGMRPLMGFNQVGITVLYGGSAQTVGDAVDGLLEGSLQRFTIEFTCGFTMLGIPRPLQGVCLRKTRCISIPLRRYKWHILSCLFTG
jgi:predicted Fe-Mo cluster-binding NifX family protein